MTAGKGVTPPGTTGPRRQTDHQERLGRPQAEVKSKLSVAIAESQQLDVSRSGEYAVAEWLQVWFELYAKPTIRPSTAEYYKRGIA